jgi:toxin ParE1/3/4
MSHRIERRPEVHRDLVGQAEYISRDNLGAALRFIDAAEATFEFLAANREVGERCRFSDPRLEEVRVWPVEGFRNHLVYFRPIDDGVQIVRVLHGARDVEALFGEGR